MAGKTSSKNTKSSEKIDAPKKSGTKKSASSGKKASSSSRSGRSVDAKLKKDNQLFAIILFALGILLTLFALFNGPILWGTIHQILRGIFGPMSYAVGPVCIAVSLKTALEQTHEEVHLRVWELVFFFVLLCGTIQFFFGYPEGNSFFERIVCLYTRGTILKSGGLLAGITGWPLMKVFKSGGSLIIHLILLFVLIMIVSGTTLGDLIDATREPFTRIRENYEDNQEVRRVRRETREQLLEEDRDTYRAARLEQKKQQAVQAAQNDVERIRQRRQEKFNIDIPMSPEDNLAAAEAERRRAAEREAELGRKKKASAQGLDEAYGNISGKPVVFSDPPEVAESDEAEKSGADEPSLDAIISAFKKKTPETAVYNDSVIDIKLSSETDEEIIPAEEPESCTDSEAESVQNDTDKGVEPASAIANITDDASEEKSADDSMDSSESVQNRVSAAIDSILNSQPELPNDETEEIPESVVEPEKSQSEDQNHADIRMEEALQAITQEPDIVELSTEQAAPEENKTESENPSAPEEAPVEDVYQIPPVSLLKLPKNNNNEDISAELRQNADKITETLKSFGVQARIIDITRGPAVTRYELQPATGVKISKITGLVDDITLNLARGNVRIEAPIPNKAAVGIEVRNEIRDNVSIREIIDSDEFRNASGALPAGFGRDVAGQIIIGDIAAMPHMLIAGTTGSGKSVCVNAIIISLLYRFSPKDLKMIMVDPKMVEMTIYNGIPHLLIPTVTDPRKASGALGWAVNEMEKRYQLLADHNVRDIKGFNRLEERNRTTHEVDEPLEHMPYIVIIIDELADLMMVASKEVEDAIIRIAQKGRAAGINLIVATQRPSADVVTGLIRSNIPSRVALTVSSQIDSRIILDQGGAEKLLGHGDMLFAPIGKKPTRVQGCYVSDEEVEDVVSFIKSNLSSAVEYDKKIIADIEQRAASEDGGKKGKGEAISDGDSDPLIMDAIDVILDAGQASTSYLQRKLKVGYARAARLMDELEDRGIVGPQDGAKPRELQITRSEWAEIKARMENA